MIIDPPSPFAPLADWEAFLADMLALPQDEPAVIAAVAEAREMIALFD